MLNLHECLTLHYVVTIGVYTYGSYLHAYKYVYFHISINIILCTLIPNMLFHTWYVWMIFQLFIFELYYNSCPQSKKLHVLNIVIITFESYVLYIYDIERQKFH